MFYFIAYMFFAICTMPCSAQAEDASKPYLFSLKGIYTHPISTNSSLAQEYFDQGMVFYYGYNFDEAARSFQYAAELDPRCAMCYWGVALSSNNLAIVKENLRKAQELMSGATLREQAYIKALTESHVPERSSQQDRDKRFAKAMKVVHEQYPDDLDAATIYANYEYTTNPLNSLEEAKRIFRQTLEKNPKHPGANHYYIHLIEVTSKQPEEALASAHTMESLIPFAGHLLHMPGHIYFILGRFDETAHANKRAIQADEELFAKGGAKGDYYAGYYLHNHQFLIAALVMEGKKEEALQVAKKIDHIINKDHLTLSVYSQNVLSAQRLLILLRFDDWDQILKEPKPGTPIGNGVWHFSRSLAYSHKNEIDQAKAEAAAIQNEHVGSSDEALNTFLKVLTLDAQAAIAEREGDRHTMVEKYLEAIKIEDPLFNFGPPIWFNSSREALANAYLRVGNRQDAEKLFRKDLEKHPNKRWSLNGLKNNTK